MQEQFVVVPRSKGRVRIKEWIEKFSGGYVRDHDFPNMEDAITWLKETGGTYPPAKRGNGEAIKRHCNAAMAIMDCITMDEVDQHIATRKEAEPISSWAYYRIHKHFSDKDWAIDSSTFYNPREYDPVDAPYAAAAVGYIEGGQKYGDEHPIYSIAYPKKNYS